MVLKRDRMDKVKQNEDVNFIFKIYMVKRDRIDKVKQTEDVNFISRSTWSFYVTSCSNVRCLTPDSKKSS